MSIAQRSARMVFETGYRYGLWHAFPVHTRQYLSDALESAWCAGYHAARLVVLLPKGLRV